MHEGALWISPGLIRVLWLRVAAHPANETGSGRYRVRVADERAGIAPEHLPHLFDRFYQAEAPWATPGSSLRLAIAKQIVDQHGST